MTLTLTVPGTDQPLVRRGDYLEHDSHAFGRCDGEVWDLVLPSRRATLDAFAASYAAVRAAEHREMPPEAIRRLPLVDADHPLAEMWRQRSASFALFVDQLSGQDEGVVVDIGAGCAWLAANLARGGWEAAAVDVTVEGGDGLAAATAHDEQLFLARAEMEALPFATNSIDLAVFNASLHYAGEVNAALREAARVVRPGGTLAVLDSPVFVNASAGHTMVDQLAEQIERTHGVKAAAHEGPGFVTEAELAVFGFARHELVTGLRKRVHQWRGSRRAGRETATRPVLLATIEDDR